MDDLNWTETEVENAERTMILEYVMVNRDTMELDAILQSIALGLHRQ